MRVRLCPTLDFFEEKLTRGVENIKAKVAELGLTSSLHEYYKHRDVSKALKVQVKSDGDWEAALSYEL